MDPEAVSTTARVPHGGCTDPSILDFSANCNPLKPPDTAAVCEQAVDRAGRYPNDDYPAFRQAAGEYLGVPADQIVPTSGGLAAIRLALATAVSSGDSVLVPEPGFGEYAREVGLQGGNPVFVDEASIPTENPAPYTCAIVCNPTNPTGRGYDRTALEDFAKRCRETDTELLVDEAFLGFTDHETMAGESGVVVARSLTKLFGIPGIRAGFLVANGDRWDALEQARRAWNLGVTAAAVGTHCMESPGFVKETKARVREERAHLQEDLSRWFSVRPSVAPFLLCEVGNRSVGELCDSLRDRGIVVRDARSFRGLDNHIRIAVRTQEDHDRLLGVINDVLG